MEIHVGIRPGDIGAITRLHGVLYSREYGLDHTFEGYVASAIGDFALQFTEGKDYLAVVEDDGEIRGSVAIVGQGKQAQLRWFLVDPSLRGRGIGRRLLHGAIDFCREQGFTSIYLWTISELTTAAKLYQEAGFRLTEQDTHEIWGAVHTEERYDLDLVNETEQDA